MKQYLIEVAGHVFSLGIPDGFPDKELGLALAPYEPFMIEAPAPAPLFRIEIQQTPLDTADFGHVIRRFGDEPTYCWVLESKEGLRFGFSLSPDCPELLVCLSSDLASVTLHLPSALGSGMLRLGVDNASMLAYALASSSLDTVLIHASVVATPSGRAAAFTGHSGSGKSTHSRLWLRNIEGAELINDDNPVVRVEDGRPFIYGSPWSGKTPCYRKVRCTLAGFAHIYQAPENRFEKLSGLKAYASFIGSCSSVKWIRSIADGIDSTVQKLLPLCTFGNLYCLPDADAARLSYKNLIQS